MTETISRDGLARLVHFELKRLNFSNRADATRELLGRIGVYDINGETINAEVDSYFAANTTGYRSH